MKSAFAATLFFSATQAKLGAPPRAPKFLQSDVVSEPGQCCWYQEVFEGRLTDTSNDCSKQWRHHVAYCFPDGLARNDRCKEIYEAIGNDEWELITPESATCYTVEFKCFEPDAYDYYGTDVECIQQWKDFDQWCWNDPNHDEEHCETVNKAYQEEMERRRRLVLLANEASVEEESSSGFASGFGIAAGVAAAVGVFLAVSRCSSKNGDF